MDIAKLSTLSHYISNKILRQPERFIAPNEPLISSGLIDSFNLVDLSLFVEDNFNVHIDDTELNAETFDTLTELVNLIEERQPL